jgi:hypothetical protein
MFHSDCFDDRIALGGVDPGPMMRVVPVGRGKTDKTTKTP